MINICLLDGAEAKKYCSHIDKWCGNLSKALMCIEEAEMYKHLEIVSSDSFIQFEFEGSFEEFKKEIKLINKPRKICKMVVAIKGGNALSITDISVVTNAISEHFESDTEEWLIGYTDAFGDKDVMSVHVIIKTYSNADLSDEDVFSGVWKKVLSEAELDGDESFYNAVKSLTPIEVSNDVIELKLPQIPTAKFIMMLKRERLEALINEYTGKDYSLKIVE